MHKNKIIFLSFTIFSLYLSKLIILLYLFHFADILANSIHNFPYVVFTIVCNITPHCPIIIANVIIPVAKIADGTFVI